MLTATVASITTCDSLRIYGGPQVDVLQLTFKGIVYFVQTDEVGKYKVGEEVSVESTDGHSDIPRHLRLNG